MRQRVRKMPKFNRLCVVRDGMYQMPYLVRIYMYCTFTLSIQFNPETYNFLHFTKLIAFIVVMSVCTTNRIESNRVEPFLLLIVLYCCDSHSCSKQVDMEYYSGQSSLNYVILKALIFQNVISSGL